MSGRETDAPASDSLAPYGALSFLYFGSMGLFSPYAPLWFQSLGFSTLTIGAIASLQSWTRVIAPYGWSWLGDHWGLGARRVELLRIATALIFVCSLGLLVFTNVFAVAATVAAIFIVNGAVIPLSEAAVAQRLATAQGLDMGRYGRIRVWGSIGFIVAVTLFGALLQSTGIDALPWCYALVIGLLAAVAWRLPPPPPAAGAATAPAGVKVWPILRRPEVAWFFAGIFFTVLAHTSLYVFLSLYLDAQGFGKAQVGALWAVGVVVEVGFFLTQGHWFARCSAHTWLLIAAWVSALRFAAMALLGSAGWLLAATQCTHAITFAAQHAACIKLIDRHFAGATRGRGQALYATLGYGLSGVIGGVGGGAISQRWGFEAVFGAAALVSLLAVLCCTRSREIAARNSAA